MNYDSLPTNNVASSVEAVSAVHSNEGTWREINLYFLNKNSPVFMKLL